MTDENTEQEGHPQLGPYVGIVKATCGTKDLAAFSIWNRGNDILNTRSRLESFIKNEEITAGAKAQVVDPITDYQGTFFFTSESIETLEEKTRHEFTDMPFRRHSDKTAPSETTPYMFMVKILGTGLKRMTTKGVDAIVQHKYQDCSRDRDLLDTKVGKRIQAYQSAGYRIVGTEPEEGQPQDEYVMVDLEENDVWKLMLLSDLEQEVPLEAKDEMDKLDG